LISAGLEWGFELKRRHGTTFGRYLTIGNSTTRKQRAQIATPTDKRDATGPIPGPVASESLNIVST
jgi:hypothetical protein